MPPAWKWDDTRPGPQMAAVWVSEERGNGFYVVVGKGYSAHIDASALHPLPPTLSPEQAAVIEAAEKWRADAPWTLTGFEGPTRDLASAVDDLRASLAPRNPVADVSRIWDERTNVGMTVEWRDRMSAAIAALSERGT